MKTLSIVFLGVLAFTAVTGCAEAPGHLNKMHGLTFATIPEFSAPEPAGLDALRIVHPEDAKPGTERMSITMVNFAADAVGEGGMSDVELLEYVKTTFLATSTAGTLVERTFFAQKIGGEAFGKSIPNPARGEVYVVPLKTGDKVVLGFIFAPEFAAQAGQVIVEVAASLRED